MHVYNAWLPADLSARAADLEPKRFTVLARTVADTWAQDGGPRGRGTLKWVSVVYNFLSSKSTFAQEDVELVARTALDIIIQSHNDLFTQVRWMQLLKRLLRKYRHSLLLGLSIPWRPLYDLLLQTHFLRRETYDGAGMQQIHLSGLVHLVASARRYFPAGSAAEIWEELRPGFDDLAHNDALRAAGLVSLFLPTRSPLELQGAPDPSARWQEWVPEWVELWGKIPFCHFWDLQWGSLIARCASHLAAAAVDWEPLLPALFTRHLAYFELPVGRAGSKSPGIERPAPRECVRAFGSALEQSMSKYIAKTIMLLMAPGPGSNPDLNPGPSPGPPHEGYDSLPPRGPDGLPHKGHNGPPPGGSGGGGGGGVGSSSTVLARFEVMVEYVEQYFHPSNGGAWTRDLERLLRHLAFFFLKRLALETRGELSEAKGHRPALRVDEMTAVVRALLRLLERAQYSKNGYLAGTAANTAAGLAMVAPNIVLPFVLSRFELALTTVTATHQLEAALLTLALSTRPLLLASRPLASLGGGDAMDIDFTPSGGGGALAPPSAEEEELVALGREQLAAAMQATLAGIDANDPPKTLSTLQIYFSVLSSVGVVGDVEDGGGGVLPLDWSVWLDDFLSRLLALLAHLEPSPNSSSSSSYLVREAAGSPFRPTLELLFARCTPALYDQALRKVSKHVLSNMLPGALLELWYLLGALSCANPAKAMDSLLVPLARKVLDLLESAPSTGFAALGGSAAYRTQKVVPLSAALETSVTYYLTLLCGVLSTRGDALLPHKDLLLQVVAAAFNASSNKVFDGGSKMIQTLLEGLLTCYPLDQYRVVGTKEEWGGVEPWFSTKGQSVPAPDVAPLWHIASSAELAFAEELLEAHLHRGLEDLQFLCQLAPAEGSLATGRDKDAWHVVLARIFACLHGTRMHLPDFEAPPPADSPLSDADVAVGPLTVLGLSAPVVGTAQLRERCANVLHQACQHILRERADDVLTIHVLSLCLDYVVNFGAAGYSEWVEGKQRWATCANMLTETRATTLYPTDALGRRRPRWLMVDKVHAHIQWRISQAGYRLLYPTSREAPAPPPVAVLLQDLLQLSLNKYKAVRGTARPMLERVLKRFPQLTQQVTPQLHASLLGDESEDEAAIGACSVYTSRPLMRHLTQSWEALVPFVAALLGSARHESAKAQAAIGETFLFFALRFASLPAGGGRGTQDEAHAQLLQTLTALVASPRGGQGPPVHWRYVVMAGTFMLLLVPRTTNSSSSNNSSNGASISSPAELPTSATTSPTGAAELFVRSLGSDLPPLRRLAGAALLLLLPPPQSSRLRQREGDKEEEEEDGKDSMDTSHASGRDDAGAGAGGSGAAVGSLTGGGAATELSRRLWGDSQLAATIVMSLAADHHLEGAGGKGGGGHGGGGFLSMLAGAAGSGGSSTDKTGPLVAALASSASGAEWPTTKARAGGTTGQGFSAANALLFERLADAFGTPLVDALREPLQAAVQALSERGQQCVAAEAMAGLLHAQSDAVGIAWDEWLRELVQLALLQAPVESTSDWTACVRYAATGRRGSGHVAPPLRENLLTLLAAPLSESAASGQLAKRLNLIGAALGEALVGPQSAGQVAFQRKLFAELTGNMAHPAQQVREAVGCLLAMMCASLAPAPPTGRHVAAAAEWDAFRADALEWLAALPAKAEVAATQIQAAADAGGAVAASASASASASVSGAANGGAPQGVSSPALAPAAAGARNGNDERMQVDGNGGGAAGAGGEEDKEATRWMETVLQMVRGSIKSGDAVCLTPTIAALLPALLAVQECADDDLSFLAKLALAYTKDQLLPAPDAAAAASALVAAAGAANWHTRAASLSFIQSFVFRHVFVLGGSHLAALRACVIKLLADNHLEVRELASVTLAGLLKGGDATWGEEVRAECVRSAQLALKKRRSGSRAAGRVAAKASSSASASSLQGARDKAAERGKLVELHGPVLGLAACVLSSPYDLPKWMPEILMILAQFASEPSPVNKAVSKTVEDFRRTHTDTWALHKQEFSPEQLEVLSELSSSSSYYV